MGYEEEGTRYRWSRQGKDLRLFLIFLRSLFFFTGNRIVVGVLPFSKLSPRFFEAEAHSAGTMLGTFYRDRFPNHVVMTIN